MVCDLIKHKPYEFVGHAHTFEIFIPACTGTGRILKRAPVTKFLLRIMINHKSASKNISHRLSHPSAGAFIVLAMAIYQSRSLSRAALVFFSSLSLLFSLQFSFTSQCSISFHFCHLRAQKAGSHITVPETYLSFIDSFRSLVPLSNICPPLIKVDFSRLSSFLLAGAASSRES